MLIEVDAAQLEVRVAAFLSQDPTLMQEILDGKDIHSDNMARFGLPDRLIAKVYIFRLLYGGSAYSYANDNDFMAVSKKQEFWQDVIEKTYEKYKGLAKWHKQIVEQVMRTGKLAIPSGRVYQFQKNQRGEWPRTQILNYPVQGFGAELMMLARVQLYRRLRPHRHRGILLVNTVHDSNLVDCRKAEVDFVIDTMREVFNNLDKTASKCFGIDFNVPLGCDIKIGMDWLNMEKV